MKPVIAALIVAAGRGQRMGSSGGPKQYRLLAGKPVLTYSLRAFLDHPQITHVQVVVHRDDLDGYEKAAPSSDKLQVPVLGGQTRQQSALAGLEALTTVNPDTVLIHDAARPFLAAELIDRLIDEAGNGAAALPATPVTDTLKREDNGTVSETVSRYGLWSAQTPQCFSFADILEVHRRFAGENTSFTDDAAIAEAAGIAVRLVEAPASNFKITTEEDLDRAQRMISTQITDIRTGNGYDVHRTGPGNAVILCGVKIPCDFALVGHSDADVGLHALTDALLGTIGAGDIGSHFPPEDPQWRGANSNLFLEHAAILVRERGGGINHLDVTLICERPKIGPHREAMRTRIAEICDVLTERVSVKATTNETIGSIGRGEGVAALATATVNFSSYSRLE